MLSYSEFCKDKKSYSHTDSKNTPLDHKLKQYLNFPNGFFIEVGAHNGINQSNTKIFEDLFGWKGLLVEPSKKAFLECKKNRSNSIVENYALVSNEHKKKKISGDFNGGCQSSIYGKRLKSKQLVNVKAITLNKLLEKNKIKKVDFLSLDVEGYELNVLNGFNLEIYNPKYLLIEIYSWDFEKIINYLKEKKYDLKSNFTNYNKIDNPLWDGTHNDYLFVKIE